MFRPTFLSPAIAVVAITALSFGFAASAQTTPAAKQEAVPVKLGDTWTYSLKFQLEAPRNEQFQVTVAAINGDRWTAKQTGTVTGETSSERGHDWKMYKNSYNGAMLEFKPYALDNGFPLEVGKSFKSESNFIGTQGNAISNKYDGKVTGVEKITLAGTTFDAWVIEANGWWQAGSFGGRQTSKIWYAPAARAMVKTETKRWRPNAQLDQAVSSELTSFKLAD